MPFKTELSFEDKETKRLLTSCDFEYFMMQNFSASNYREEEIALIYTSYSAKHRNLVAMSKVKKKQFNLFLEGQVRKMFTGGLLPALFHLDESREHYFLDFAAVGEDWAYFNLWSKYYKRKLSKEKTWDWIVKSGSILGIILSIIKVVELLAKSSTTSN